MFLHYMLSVCFKKIFVEPWLVEPQNTILVALMAYLSMATTFKSEQTVLLFYI